MNCPYCGFDNIEGIEQCGQCEADLTGVEESRGSHDIEKDLLHRPLREILTSDILDVSEDAPVGKVLRDLTDADHNFALAHAGDQLTGIFTERDILYKLAGSVTDHDVQPVRNFMTAGPETLHAEDPIAFALNRMMVGGFRHIPVMDDGRLVGVVSVRDILDYMVSEFSDTLQAAPGG